MANIYKGKTKGEVIEIIYTMHLQNTNSRESDDEMFKLGIEAAIEEMSDGLQITSEEDKALNLLCVTHRYLKRKYREHYNKGFKDGQRNQANSEWSRKQLNGG